MLSILLWAFCALISCVGVLCTLEDGPQLWDLEASSRHPLLASLQYKEAIDIWSTSEGTTKVIVEPESATELKRTLNNANITYNVVVHNLLDLIQAEENHMKNKTRKHKKFQDIPIDWTSYHKFEDIERYIAWLDINFQDLVEVIPVAITEEGRYVYVVKVRDPSATSPKKKIWIEGGIHAREWISPAATTYLLHQVVTNSRFKPILKRTVWYFVPVANPDGYVHSFSGGRARLWRKNRKKINLFLPDRCRGVDLNRNWDFKWDVGGSNNLCSHSYKGPEPFSEPETNGLRSLMVIESPLDIFIALHSYGQNILYPWGWTFEPPDNLDRLLSLGNIYIESVKQASKGKTCYNIVSSANYYGYLASGTTKDWSYGILKSTYSYTIELPDARNYGFLLPENQITETVKETTVGIYCMIGKIIDADVC